VKFTKMYKGCRPKISESLRGAFSKVAYTAIKVTKKAREIAL